MEPQLTPETILRVFGDVATTDQIVAIKPD
jgi:hypothetical protein